MELFRRSQKIYGMRAARRSGGAVPAGYGICAPALVDVALQCCAKGE